MKLGIGVTTMGRPQALERLVSTLQAWTDTPFTLVVADDGDLAPPWVQDESIYLRNPRGGVARNKNRCLYRLFEIEKCDVVFLLDDDVFFTDEGWELPFIEAALKYGHINKHYGSHRSGEGTVSNPYIASEYGGHIIGLSKDAFAQVGYMHPRFKNFGLEHCDFTRRYCQNGFGGYHDEDGITWVKALAEVGFRSPGDFGTTGTQSDISENIELFKSLKTCTGFITPWDITVEGDKERFIQECTGI